MLILPKTKKHEQHEKPQRPQTLSCTRFPAQNNKHQNRKFCKKQKTKPKTKNNNVQKPCPASGFLPKTKNAQTQNVATQKNKNEENEKPQRPQTLSCARFPAQNAKFNFAQEGRQEILMRFLRARNHTATRGFAHVFRAVRFSAFFW